MATKKQTFDFSTSLNSSSTGRSAQDIPKNKLGVKLSMKDAKTGRYEVRLHISEATSKRAGLHAQGRIVARISACSSAMQIEFDPTASPDFKGYVLRAAGGSKNEQEAKLAIGVPYQFNSYVTIKAEQLDLTKTKLFPITYVPILNVKKNEIIVDISTLPIIVSNK